MKRKPAFLTMALASSYLVASCSSSQTMIFPKPPKNYEVLGHAEGSASGSLGVLGTAYYFIPMGINGRTARAYSNALRSVPGASGLINVTIQESWWWWIIGTGRTVTITGEAIREKRS
jgi:hypothetical protein